jgi:hypothetical protein
MTAAPAISNLTEEFNGSGWTAGGNTNTSRRQGAGFGIQTAAVKTAGYDGSSPSNDNTSEEYNGTAWTTGNNVNPQRQGHAGAGTLTAGVIFGGTDGTLLNKTEEYDGTNFSNVNTMNTARTNLSGAGSQTTSIAFGGATPPVSNAAEVYDGTNWTTAANMNTARNAMGSFGDSNSAVGTGGTTGSNSTATETWDGTSWTTSPASLGTARAFYGDTGSGSSTAGIVAGGYSTATVGLTEEYNFGTNIITAAAWSSAPSIGTGRYLGGYGITPTNASIIFGGQSTTSESKTEEYNGTNWAENPDMNTARSRINGFGTQTAAVTMGGRQVGVPPNVNMNNTELYDGSSWTNGPSYPLTVRGIGGAGTNAAGLAIAAWTGSPPGFTTCNDWNGSGWTAAEANLNTARGYVSGWGTQSDAGAAGGPPANTDYEEYNGSSWTTKASLVTATGGPSGGAAGFGGTPGAIKANGNGGTFSQEWNGTSWGTAASRANTNYGGGMSGGNTAASGIVTGGYIYPSTGPATGSEEFTGETSAVAPASNITTS